MVGRKMSATVPGSVPVKDFGPTPMIWNILLPMWTLRPRTWGSLAKRRDQEL
jgi:hypothetical protein